MRKLLLVLCLLAVSLWTVAFIENTKSTDSSGWREFCKGWEEGHCEGWKTVRGEFASCPSAPSCPPQRPLETTYKHGYNRGFIKGRKDAGGN
jgi:hypothetical protein